MHTIRKFLRIYNGFIVPIVLLVLSVGVVAWGVMPGIGKIQNLLDDSKSLADENTLIKKRVDLLNSLNEDTLQTQMKALLSAVPSEKNVPSFFTSLDALALQSGITLTEFTLAAPGSISTPSAKTVADVSPESTDKTQVNGSIVAIGTLDQLQDFQTKLVAVRRLFKVTRMSLVFPKESDQLQMSMDVNAFYAPLPQTLGNAAETISPLTSDEEAVLAKIEGFQDITEVAAAQLETQSVRVGDRPDPFSL